MPKKSSFRPLFLPKFKTKVRSRGGQVIRPDVSPQLGLPQNKDSIRYRIAVLPRTGDDKALYVSLGVPNTAANDAFRAGVQGIVKEASVKTLVFEAMVNRGIIPGSQDIIDQIRELMED